MTVGVQVGNIINEVGSADFFHSFFSTISYHLEPDGWGTNYPELMKEMYQGKLLAKHAAKVHQDLLFIREQLKAFLPDQVIWDIDDLSARPPWGNTISSHVTDLSNYFVTSTGRDLFDVLLECLDFLQEEDGALTIEHY
jgi:2,3-bisphosphoglycerate-dependent phosphoglycerate mutase